MAKTYDYDFIVIGSGLAGTTAAEAAKKEGMKVAVVEASTWGGSSLNDSDVPYSAMLHFSHLYSAAKNGARFGLSSSNLRFNFPTAFNWQQTAKERAGADNPARLISAGIDCYSGHAYFISPHEISIALSEKTETGEFAEKRLTANRFLVATGSLPSDGGVAGIDKVRCYTPAEAMRLRRLPEAIFIVGAGPTGVELAEHFASLGSTVLIADLSSRILPREDAEVAEVMTAYLSEKFGVKVLTSSRVIGVSKDGDNKRVHFVNETKEHSTAVQAVILATGAKPNTNLTLENAEVEVLKSGGVKVDKFLTTTSRHIFAAGDVISGHCSPERAVFEGAAVVKNFSKRTAVALPKEERFTFINTDPEIVSLGKTEDECAVSGLAFKKSFLPLSAVSAANTRDFEVGFIKLLADKQGAIIGATLICPHASLIAPEISLAIEKRLQARDLASTPHFSSTFAELVRLAARDLAVD
ncbi:NAD(P)/FAD-dependent oxidoreductase [Candidatus Saccharibacteria bacterium]|nr:NAD(P)/FAD-dependent oxidoreductase [Candidatus Saccharibacteria bacterium]